MKVNIFIEKDKYDDFYLWMSRLMKGIVTTPNFFIGYEIGGITNPLQISLFTREYEVLQDSLSILERLESEVGFDVVDYTPLSNEWQIQAISESLRNAKRHDIESQVVYAALLATDKIGGITPAEAMIIAEKELIG